MKSVAKYKMRSSKEGLYVIFVLTLSLNLPISISAQDDSKVARDIIAEGNREPGPISQSVAKSSTDTENPDVPTNSESPEEVANSSNLEENKEPETKFETKNSEIESEKSANEDEVQPKATPATDNIKASQPDSEKGDVNPENQESTNDGEQEKSSKTAEAGSEVEELTTEQTSEKDPKEAGESQVKSKDKEVIVSEGELQESSSNTTKKSFKKRVLEKTPINDDAKSGEESKTEDSQSKESNNNTTSKHDSRLKKRLLSSGVVIQATVSSSVVSHGTEVQVIEGTSANALNVIISALHDLNPQDKENVALIIQYILELMGVYRGNANTNSNAVNLPKILKMIQVPKWPKKWQPNPPTNINHKHNSFLLSLLSETLQRKGKSVIQYEPLIALLMVVQRENGGGVEHNPPKDGSVMKLLLKLIQENEEKKQNFSKILEILIKLANQVQRNEEKHVDIAVLEVLLDVFKKNKYITGNKEITELLLHLINGLRDPNSSLGKSATLKIIMSIIQHVKITAQVSQLPIATEIIASIIDLREDTPKTKEFDHLISMIEALFRDQSKSNYIDIVQHILELAGIYTKNAQSKKVLDIMKFLQINKWPHIWLDSLHSRAGSKSYYLIKMMSKALSYSKLYHYDKLHSLFVKLFNAVSLKEEEQQEDKNVMIVELINEIIQNVKTNSPKRVIPIIRLILMLTQVTQEAVQNNKPVTVDPNLLLVVVRLLRQHKLSKSNDKIIDILLDFVGILKKPNDSLHILKMFLNRWVLIIVKIINDNASQYQQIFDKNFIINIVKIIQTIQPTVIQQIEIPIAEIVTTTIKIPAPQSAEDLIFIIDKIMNLDQKIEKNTLAVIIQYLLQVVGVNSTNIQNAKISSLLKQILISLGIKEWPIPWNIKIDVSPATNKNYIIQLLFKLLRKGGPDGLDLENLKDLIIKVWRASENREINVIQVSPNVGKFIIKILEAMRHPSSVNQDNITSIIIRLLLEFVKESNQNNQGIDITNLEILLKYFKTINAAKYEVVINILSKLIMTLKTSQKRDSKYWTTELLNIILTILKQYGSSVQEHIKPEVVTEIVQVINITHVTVNVTIVHEIKEIVTSRPKPVIPPPQTLQDFIIIIIQNIGKEQTVDKTKLSFIIQYLLQIIGINESNIQKPEISAIVKQIMVILKLEKWPASWVIKPQVPPNTNKWYLIQMLFKLIGSNRPSGIDISQLRELVIKIWKKVEKKQTVVDNQHIIKLIIEITHGIQKPSSINQDNMSSTIIRLLLEFLKQSEENQQVIDLTTLEILLKYFQTINVKKYEYIINMINKLIIAIQTTQNAQTWRPSILHIIHTILKLYGSSVQEHIKPDVIQEIIQVVNVTKVTINTTIIHDIVEIVKPRPPVSLPPPQTVQDFIIIIIQNIGKEQTVDKTKLSFIIQYLLQMIGINESNIEKPEISAIVKQIKVILKIEKWPASWVIKPQVPPNTNKWYLIQMLFKLIGSNRPSGIDILQLRELVIKIWKIIEKKQTVVNNNHIIELIIEITHGIQKPSSINQDNMSSTIIRLLLEFLKQSEENQQVIDLTTLEILLKYFQTINVKKYEYIINMINKLIIAIQTTQNTQTWRPSILHIIHTILKLYGSSVQEHIKPDVIQEIIQVVNVTKVTINTTIIHEIVEIVKPRPPVTLPPITSRPTTSPLTTSPPTTSRPTTSRPTTSPSTTSRPTTSRPTTSPSTTSRPTTSRPTTSPSTTSRPTTSRPTTSPSTTSRPTTSRPTTSPSTTSRPTTSRPTTSPSTTSRPTTSRPTTSPSTTSRPTTSRPTTSPSTTSRPTTSRPTTSRPTTSPTTTLPPITLPPRPIIPPPQTVQDFIIIIIKYIEKDQTVDTTKLSLIIQYLLQIIGINDSNIQKPEISVIVNQIMVILKINKWYVPWTIKPEIPPNTNKWYLIQMLFKLIGSNGPPGIDILKLREMLIKIWKIIDKNQTQVVENQHVIELVIQITHAIQNPSSINQDNMSSTILRLLLEFLKQSEKNQQVIDVTTLEILLKYFNTINSKKYEYIIKMISRLIVAVQITQKPETWRPSILHIILTILKLYGSSVQEHIKPDLIQEIIQVVNVTKVTINTTIIHEIVEIVKPRPPVTLPPITSPPTTLPPTTLPPKPIIPPPQSVQDLIVIIIKHIDQDHVTDKSKLALIVQYVLQVIGINESNIQTPKISAVLKQIMIVLRIKQWPAPWNIRPTVPSNTNKLYLIDMLFKLLGTDPQYEIDMIKLRELVIEIWKIKGGKKIKIVQNETVVKIMISIMQAIQHPTSTNQDSINSAVVRLLIEFIKQSQRKHQVIDVITLEIVLKYFNTVDSAKYAEIIKLLKELIIIIKTSQDLKPQRWGPILVNIVVCILKQYGSTVQEHIGASVIQEIKYVIKIIKEIIIDVSIVDEIQSIIAPKPIGPTIPPPRDLRELIIIIIEHIRSDYSVDKDKLCLIVQYLLQSIGINERNVKEKKISAILEQILIIFNVEQWHAPWTTRPKIPSGVNKWYLIQLLFKVLNSNDSSGVDLSKLETLVIQVWKVVDRNAKIVRNEVIMKLILQIIHSIQHPSASSEHKINGVIIRLILQFANQDERTIDITTLELIRHYFNKVDVLKYSSTVDGIKKLIRRIKHSRGKEVRNWRSILFLIIYEILDVYEKGFKDHFDKALMDELKEILHQRVGGINKKLHDRLWKLINSNGLHHQTGMLEEIYDVAGPEIELF